MRYLMLVCTNDDVAPDLEPAADAEPVDNWGDEMDRRAVRVMGERIRPGVEATTVRVRHGELLVTDGPFVETKDWIAGFDILECADLDEAIEVASCHPMAKIGALELRAFWPF